MKKNLLVITLALMLWQTSFAAMRNFYASHEEVSTQNSSKTNEGIGIALFSGANWVDTPIRLGELDFKTGYLIGTSFGYKWHLGLEVEAEVIYRRNGLDHYHFKHGHFDADGHLRKWSYMANVKYYLPLYWYLSPYFGLGAGYAHQKLVINHIDDAKSHASRTKDGFAWQVLGGMTCYLCNHLDLDLKYQYLQLRGSTHDHSLSAGLKYSF
jgi:opacity protein-like surface antigen